MRENRKDGGLPGNRVQKTPRERVALGHASEGWGRRKKKVRIPAGAPKGSLFCGELRGKRGGLLTRIFSENQKKKKKFGETLWEKGCRRSARKATEGRKRVRSEKIFDPSPGKKRNTKKGPAPAKNGAVKREKGALNTHGLSLCPKQKKRPVPLLGKVHLRKLKSLPFQLKRKLKEKRRCPGKKRNKDECRQFEEDPRIFFTKKRGTLSRTSLENLLPPPLPLKGNRAPRRPVKRTRSLKKKRRGQGTRKKGRANDTNNLPPPNAKVSKK